MVSQASISQPDVLEIPTRALLIGADPAALEPVRQFLGEFGVQELTSAKNESELDLALAAATFGLIVLDWELPAPGGLAVLNRLKALPGYATTPVLVTSALLQARDFELLREIPCAALLRRPAQAPALEETLFRLLGEQSWYVENSSYVDSLLKLAEADPKAIAAELGRLVAAAAQAPAFGLIIGRALLDHGFVQAAGTVLERLAASAARSPAVLWQLGRVHYRAGRLAEARRVLDTAERLSAANVERLCFHGEVALAQKDGLGAHALFSKCLAIDGGHQRARAGRTIAANLEAYCRRHAVRDLPQTLASTCNTLGVYLAQSGKVDDGIGQYQAALVFLGDGPDVHRIAFNMGLAHLRKQALPEALSWFERSARLAGGDFAKAERYRALTHAALRGGLGDELDEELDERIGL